MSEIVLENVPLYPDTKHTTATQTAKMLGTDKVREASGLTNKAFDRYYEIENSGAFEVVTAIRKKKKGAGAEIIKINEGKKERKFKSLYTKKHLG